jgi:zinc protease
VLLGGVGTENKTVKLSLEVIRAEMARMAAEGPTAEELKNAKRYLTGSFALRFDSGAKIAAQLLSNQVEDLGIDYIDKRNGLIEAVTLADLKRVAARLLDSKDFLVVVAGQPEGLTATTN